MLGALIGAGASLLGGMFGSNAAEDAAKAQERAARHALKLQREMWETGRADMMPWLDAGRTALGQYMSQLGLGDGATGPTNAFKETPGYQWRVSEGEKGVTSNLAALGMKNSGKALKALETFRQGIASDEYDKWLGRVGGVAGQGQQSANSMAGFAQNAGNMMGQTMQDAGQARASGYVGSANAMMGGLNSAANFIGQGFGSNSFRPTYNGFSSMLGM